MDEIKSEKKLIGSELLNSVMNSLEEGDVEEALKALDNQELEALTSFLIKFIRNGQLILEKSQELDEVVIEVFGERMIRADRQVGQGLDERNVDIVNEVIEASREVNNMRGDCVKALSTRILRQIHGILGTILRKRYVNARELFREFTYEDGLSGWEQMYDFIVDIILSHKAHQYLEFANNELRKRRAKEAFNPKTFDEMQGIRSKIEDMRRGVMFFVNGLLFED